MEDSGKFWNEMQTYLNFTNEEENNKFLQEYSLWIIKGVKDPLISSLLTTPGVSKYAFDIIFEAFGKLSQEGLIQITIGDENTNLSVILEGMAKNLFMLGAFCHMKSLKDKEK